MTEESKAIYRQLRTELTTPKTSVPTFARRKENGKTSTVLLENAVKLHEQRKELQERIDSATAQVLEWERIETRITETRKQIRQWEAMMLMIDDGIQDFRRFATKITPLLEFDDSTIPHE